MKLLRYRLNGHEMPGILDESGHIDDLSEFDRMDDSLDRTARIPQEPPSSASRVRWLTSWAPRTYGSTVYFQGVVLTERQHELWWTPEYEKQIMARQALKRSLVPDDVASWCCFSLRMTAVPLRIRVTWWTQVGCR
jgi:hypothetical protein